MKATWDDKIARIWKYNVPPGRPSNSELKIFEHYFREISKKIKKPNVLILGSTPELRDLSIKYRFNPVVIDYNKNNFYILKNLMKQKGKERFVHCDWRKMNLRDKFQLVVGDLSLNMVPFTDQEKIVKKLRRIIDNGFFVHRTWIRRLDKYKNLKEIIKEHKIKRKGMNGFSSFCLPMIHYCYDQKDDCIRFGDVIRVLKKTLDKGLITKREFNDVYRIWNDYKMPNYLPNKKKFEKMIKNYFTIEDVKYGVNWFKEFCPIYVLK